MEFTFATQKDIEQLTELRIAFVAHDEDTIVAVALLPYCNFAS